MRTHLAIALVLVASLAFAQKPTDYLFPQAIPASTLVKSFLAEKTKPGYVFSSLAAAKLIASHPLFFRAQVDNRPFVVDRCILCAQVEIALKREWLLMAFFRHPYGPRIGDSQWKLSTQSGTHSPFALRRLTVRPTTRDIQEFLVWVGWDGDRTEGFQDIEYLCFPSSWQAVTGTPPPELKRASLWPPKD